MTAISCTLAQSGAVARPKLLLLGPPGFLPESLVARVCSLNLEHVSPATLVQQEISRRTPLGQQAGTALRHGVPVPDQALFALLRKWFWARKPDAGFALEGFPATLLQAKVFDEWLDARDEALTGGLCAARFSADPVAEHYRTQGLLLEPVDLAA